MMSFHLIENQNVDVYKGEQGQTNACYKDRLARIIFDFVAISIIWT